MIPDWLQIVAVGASPIFAAGGAYAAVRVRLEWLRKDVDLAIAGVADLNRKVRELEISTRRLVALGR